MEVTSFNTNMQKVAIVDSYKSFIWNDRYEDLGDFELYIPADAVKLLANIHQDYYIQCSESDRTMIVEKVDYRTDLEDGNWVIISGHSLETILQRRIIWNDIKYDEDGNPDGDQVTQVNMTKILDPLSEDEDIGANFPVWMAIEYLLKLYIIDPQACGNKPQRKIDNIEFIAPSIDDPIYSIQMGPCSYHGENLYDVIKSLCDMYEFSFKMTMNPETKKIYFSLYKGVSHLSSQTENPYVRFSNDFDNLFSSDSSLDMSTYKNMAYYKGQGTKYVVKEFDDKEITLETGNARIKNNKVYAVKIDFGINDSKNVEPNDPYSDPDQTQHYKTPLDWTPHEFNETYDSSLQSPYPKYNKGDLVMREQINGSILTEDRCFYLATEPEATPGSEEEYQAILLYSSAYDAEQQYFKCINDNGHQGPWNPDNWERIDIRVTWGPAKDFYSEYKPGTEENPVKHKEEDVVKITDTTNNTIAYWTCIEEHESTGSFDQTKWISTITHDILHQQFYNKDWGETSKDKKVRTCFDECEDWAPTKKYGAGSFVTFNDSTRTGKITIYRKTQKDVSYSTKKKYKENEIVWYKPKNGTGDGFMYIRKKYKSEKVKGIAPTQAAYWKKLTDKYKIFNAQQWEALEDIPVETYDILGSVQDENVSGMDRREMFVDATSVPSTYNYFYDNKKQETVDWLVDDGVMKATVKDMALAELTIPGNRMTKKLDAEIGYDTTFKYGVDYGIGDVVEVYDIYGYYDSVRIKEYIISHDDSGIKCYPVFEAVEASTITTRYLEVNDELLGNTFLIKIPESTRFYKPTTIATSEKDDNTYYLKSFVKKITTDSDVEKGKKVKRDIHMVAWVTTADSDIWTEYQEQAETDILKLHPTVIGEPLFYIDIDADTNMVIPGVLFPSWSPPYGTDLGVIKSINKEAGQYKNILLANI